MKFLNFIWDYDGTLFDTYDAVTRAYHRAVTELGIDISFEELRWMTKHSLGWTAKQLEEKYHVPADKILSVYYGYAPEEETMLAMLKTDLGIRTTTAYDERLGQLLTAAEAAIRAEGVETLDETDPLDQQLIVMYAAWLWRRRDEMPGMPRMLRLALNNRVFGEKAGGSDG